MQRLIVFFCCDSYALFFCDGLHKSVTIIVSMQFLKLNDVRGSVVNVILRINNFQNVFQCPLMSIAKTKLDSHSGTRICLCCQSNLDVKLRSTNELLKCQRIKCFQLSKNLVFICKKAPYSVPYDTSNCSSAVLLLFLTVSIAVVMNNG